MTAITRLSLAGGSQTALGEGSPSLANPVAASVSSATVVPRVTTSTTGGTVYAVVVPDGDSPSVAQIKAGQQSSGAAAVAAVSLVVTAAAQYDLPSVSGLTAATSYEIYFVHTSTGGADSSSVTVGFTTDAVGGSGDYDDDWWRRRRIMRRARMLRRR